MGWFLLLLTPVFAKEWIVQPSKTNDALLSTIRESDSGDVLVLNGGIFEECINTLGKDLIFEGRNGAQVVGNGSCPALVNITSGEVQLNNMSLSHKDTCVAIFIWCAYKLNMCIILYSFHGHCMLHEGCDI